MRHLFVFLLISGLPYSAIHAEDIKLSNGDTLTAKRVAENAYQIIFDHPLLGQLTIDRSDLASTPNDPTNGTNTALPAPAEPQQTLAKATATQRIEAGVNGASGNSRNSNFRLGYQHRSKSGEHRSLFNTAYQKASSEGKTDENDYFAELTYDWLLPHSQWFRFARGRYDWDDFEDWDSRLSGSGGAGYTFVDREDLTLAGRLGLGLSQTYGSQDDELTPEGIVGIDSNWRINGYQSLEFSNTLYLELDEFGELRNLTSLAWLMRINQFSGLDLKLGINNEYDSNSSGDSHSNNLKYDLSLIWQLN